VTTQSHYNPEPLVIPVVFYQKRDDFIGIHRAEVLVVDIVTVLTEQNDVLATTTSTTFRADMMAILTLVFHFSLR